MLALTFLGTGCPSLHPRRTGSAMLVESEAARVLVDCGAGVTQRLVEAGRTGAMVDALIVTHLHTDHLIDFYQLVVSSWHQGRDRPWRIHAPAPALAVMRALMDAWAGERALRIAHEKRPSVAGLEVELIELTEAPIVFADLSIRPFFVDHHPVAPAFGLEFANAAGRIVHSGDTRPCAALDAAAQGADLLVHEIFSTREMRPIPGVRGAETVAAVESYHTTPADVARIAAASDIGALALTHLVPPGADVAALIAEVRAGGYAGPCFVGEDLMRFDLPARTIAYKGAVVAL